MTKKKQKKLYLPKIPIKPGCYIMKNDLGRVIYVGKAKNIKKRVASYFKKNNDYKTTLLMQDLADIDFFVTNNEVEALILEAKLIRKFKPKYNILLKDKEKYAYIKVTKEEYPRIITARQKDKTGRYYGPYPDGFARRQTVTTLNRAFRLRPCGPKMPKVECLYYHIKQCDAPCIGKISKQDYLERVKLAEMYLKGKSKQLIKQLNTEMKYYSKSNQFEKAKERRDQIYALNRISQKQIISLDKKYNQDVINYIKSGTKIMFEVFNINKGVISGRKDFKFNQLKGSLAEFIKQYYFEHDIPEEIIIPEEIEGKNIIEKYLSKIKNKKVEITVPVKGDKAKLLELAKTNLSLNLSECDQTLLNLQEVLLLPTLPKHIECFDISNLGDKFTVGSMVHFVDCKPDKNNYRRFKIRFVKAQNDVAMISEVVSRRYYRLVKEKADLPDLIVIDGGKAQLNAAKKVLTKLKLDISIIGLAKKFEEVYLVGKSEPIRLSKKDNALKLLQRVRNEAHRFAITYNRLLRSKQIASNG